MGKEPEHRKFFAARRPQKKRRRFSAADKQRTSQSRPMKKTEITVTKAAKRVIEDR